MKPSAAGQSTAPCSPEIKLCGHWWRLHGSWITLRGGGGGVGLEIAVVSKRYELERQTACELAKRRGSSELDHQATEECMRLSWRRQEYLKSRYCTWCTRWSIYILVQFEVSLHVVSIFSIFGVTSFSIFSAFFSIFSVSVFLCIFLLYILFTLAKNDELQWQKQGRLVPLFVFFIKWRHIFVIRGRYLVDIYGWFRLRVPRGILRALLEQACGWFINGFY